MTMPVAADTSTVDDKVATVIVDELEEVEDTDESTKLYKRRKLDDSAVVGVCLTIQKKMSDKAVLLSGELDDKIISAAQKLLFKFPSLMGYVHWSLGRQTPICKYSIVAQTIGLQ